MDANDQDKIIHDTPKNSPLFKLYTGSCTCKDFSMNVCNLMVLGQTGSGKTTLLNSFVNFLLGISFFDDFRYQLVDEQNLIAERTKSAAQAGLSAEE